MVFRNTDLLLVREISKENNFSPSARRSFTANIRRVADKEGTARLTVFIEIAETLRARNF